MTDKKLHAKRLLLFLLLVFGIAWIPALILNHVFGYHAWFETNKMPLFALPVLYAPALANLLTRKLTHEGWENSMLHLRLRGNLKYYLTAVFIVSVISIPSGVMTTLICGNGDWSDLGAGYSWQQAVSAIIMTFATAPLLAFITFGEEFGWRGYMNQHMEPLLGTAGTVIVGGIIWGLWHAVLTVQGHNFGTDYPGFPYLGILAMCVECMFLGMLLMWLTKKTGSIYPACIVHAMQNFGGSIVGQLLVSGVSPDFHPSIPQSLLCNIPSFAVCIVFLVLMLRNQKKPETVK